MMAAEQLSARQTIFVTEYLKDRNGTQAAIRAGYSERTAGEQASRLLANVKVKQIVNKKQENINKDLREMFADEAVNAFKVLKEIMMKGAAMDKDRLAAAKDLLDRAGYKPVDKIVADLTTRTYEDQLSELDDDG
jgi:phage terminase small subunit